jgi:hypothetical protein
VKTENPSSCVTVNCKLWKSAIALYCFKHELIVKKGKDEGKDIPVTGREGPLGCERSRLPHYLDKRLTDGGKVVSPTRRPPFIPRFLF